MVYIINIGDFTANEIIYHNRCLSASIGGQGIESDTIPWGNTQYEPWDFKYENNQFLLDPIVISTPAPTPTPEDLLEAQVLYTATMTGTLLGE